MGEGVRDFEAVVRMLLANSGINFFSHVNFLVTFAIIFCLLDIGTFCMCKIQSESLHLPKAFPLGFQNTCKNFKAFKISSAKALVST